MHESVKHCAATTTDSGGTSSASLGDMPAPAAPLAVASDAHHFCWQELPCERILGGITRRYITTADIMLGQVSFQRGDKVPLHAHENEQFTCVLSGVLRFWLGPDGVRQVDVRAGGVIVIPSGLPHRVEALEDTLEFDIFNPPREDWINPSSPLLRD